MFACAHAQAAEGIAITQAQIEASDEGYRLSARFAFELNHGLEDALLHGTYLYFTTEIELTRPRWYWFPDKAVSRRQTVGISYNAITRQYRVSQIGAEHSVQQSFSSLEDALFLIRRPNRWLIAPKGALEAGKQYEVSLRMVLDREYLSKPIQVNAFNNADWRLSSDLKTFSYKAE
ncbi:MAG: DUF4390 domain-containing protein [Pseudomonadota bacterium]